MFNDLLRVIKDNNIKINLDQNKINICNYKEIIDINDTNIKINCNNFILLINGDNLVVKSLLDNEILITGVIKKVELI